LCSASKLPFKDQYFNKAFTVNTVYFWENPMAEMQEIYRLIKPGGAFILAFRPKHTMQNYPFTVYGFRMYET
ncbi:MAG: methyltransferase domain-containing protein, partial [Sphingobacteriales bacterium]